MTRIQRDLSSSPHQENSPEANGDGPMFRRAAGRIPQVCVVGAGVAGLRCADVLLQHGVKVTIVEGRNRVGGRLCQGTIGGHMVDLGPNWIHGTDNNPILVLAKETNTQAMSWDGRQSVFDHLGDPMPAKEAAENTELVWAIIEQAMQYSNDNSAQIPAEKSLFDFFYEQIDKILPSTLESEDEVTRKKETILNMAEMWGAFVGSPIQRQSLKFFWMEECIDGENLFVADTYHKVLARIAQPALGHAEIKFSHKVRSVTSKGTEEEPRITVAMEGQAGAALDQTFDEVIMTAPLGWLKKHQDAFVPELPNRLKQAIDSIGYGHLDKVYITFPTSFWNEEPSDSFSSSPNQQTVPNVTATTAPVHQDPSASTVSTKLSNYPGFAHWTSPRYAHSTNPSHWNQEAVNLAALPGQTAHPTLLFYTFGPTSLHLATLLKRYPSPSSPDAQKLLADFFTPYFSRLPNYSSSEPSHQPTEILATVWANDELAGYGSYSNFQVGLERGGDDVEVMRRGMPERGVWLAGEHTSPFVALGTVTGAYWAGEGVARRIIGSYGLGKGVGE